MVKTSWWRSVLLSHSFVVIQLHVLQFLHHWKVKTSKFLCLCSYYIFYFVLVLTNEHTKVPWMGYIVSINKLSYLLLQQEYIRSLCTDLNSGNFKLLSKDGKHVNTDLQVLRCYMCLCSWHILILLQIVFCISHDNEAYNLYFSLFKEPDFHPWLSRPLNSWSQLHWEKKSGKLIGNRGQKW